MDERKGSRNSRTNKITILFCQALNLQRTIFNFPATVTKIALKEVIARQLTKIDRRHREIRLGG